MQICGSNIVGQWVLQLRFHRMCGRIEKSMGKNAVLCAQGGQYLTLAGTNEMQR